MRALHQQTRRRQVILVAQQRGQVRQRDTHFRMVVAECRTLNAQGPLVQPAGGDQVAVRLQHKPKIAKVGGDVGIVRPKLLFA